MLLYFCFTDRCLMSRTDSGTQQGLRDTDLNLTQTVGHKSYVRGLGRDPDLNPREDTRSKWVQTFRHRPRGTPLGLKCLLWPPPTGDSFLSSLLSTFLLSFFAFLPPFPSFSFSFTSFFLSYHPSSHLSTTFSSIFPFTLMAYILCNCNCVGS